MSKVDSTSIYGSDRESSEPFSRSLIASGSMQDKLDPRYNTAEHMELREAWLRSSSLKATDVTRDHVRRLLRELADQKRLADQNRNELVEKQKELDDAEKELKRLEDENDELTGLLEKAQNDIANAENNKKDLEDALSAQDDVNARLKEQLEALENGNKELENLLAQKDEEAKALEEQNNALQREKEDQDEKLAKANEELGNMKDYLEEENEKLQDTLKNKADELAEANRQNGNLRERLAELEENLNNAAKENAKLKKQLDSKDSIINDMGARVDSLADKYAEMKGVYDSFYDEANAKQADNLAKIEEAKKENEKSLDALGAAVILLHKINEAAKRCKECVINNMDLNVEYPEAIASASASSPHSSYSASSSSSSSSASPSPFTSSSHPVIQKDADEEPGKKNELDDETKQKLTETLEPLDEMLAASKELKECIDDIVITKGETDLSKYAEQFCKATKDVSLDIPLFDDIISNAAIINDVVNKRVVEVAKRIDNLARSQGSMQTKAQEAMKNLEEDNAQLNEELDKIDKMTRSFHQDNIDTARKVKLEKDIDVTSIPALAKSNYVKSNGNVPDDQTFEGRLEDIASLNDPSVANRVEKALDVGTTVKDSIIDCMQDNIEDLKKDKKKLKEELDNMKDKFEEGFEELERLRSERSSLVVELQASASTSSLYKKEAERLAGEVKKLKEKNRKVKENLKNEKLARREVARSRWEYAQIKTEKERRLDEEIRAGMRDCGINTSKGVALHVSSPVLVKEAAERMTTEELRSVAEIYEKSINGSQAITNNGVTTTSSVYKTPNQSRK